MNTLNRGPVIISLEIESMRQKISTMLADQMIDLDGQIKAALDEFCAEARLGQHIRRVTREVTEQVVKETVERYFRHGPGYKAIEAAVTERLDEDLAKLVKESRL